MSVEKVSRKGGEVVWRVRWRDHRGQNRSKVLGRKADADAFDGEIKRRRRTGELAAMDGGRETLDEYVPGPGRELTRSICGREPAGLLDELRPAHLAAPGLDAAAEHQS